MYHSVTTKGFDGKKRIITKRRLQSMMPIAIKWKCLPSFVIGIQIPQHHLLELRTVGLFGESGFPTHPNAISRSGSNYGADSDDASGSDEASGSSSQRA